MTISLSSDAELDFLIKCQHLDLSERQSLADTFAKYVTDKSVPEELRDCAEALAKIARSSGGKGQNFVRG